jgi:hypothetical protein
MFLIVSFNMICFVLVVDEEVAISFAVASFR